MMDPNVTVIALLNADPAVQALTAGRIYSPRTPAGYRPDNDNFAISLSIRGGPSPSLYVPIVEPSFQVVAWAMSTKKARAVMAAAYTVLHDLQDQHVTTVDGVTRVLSGICEVYPQDVIDSSTQWFTCVGFYRLKMKL